ncbi:hypothetical protein L484_025028 [Morus notabilis]|uniref:Uncharacterized protein n=1 Tax=Morus notabilis TaxID=981085 RepID=W9QVJ3_9ROSA|nr:hypothetical protein L484_025028 [Morus notabilis]
MPHVTRILGEGVGSPHVAHSKEEVAGGREQLGPTWTTQVHKEMEGWPAWTAGERRESGRTTAVVHDLTESTLAHASSYASRRRAWWLRGAADARVGSWNVRR